MNTEDQIIIAKLDKIIDRLDLILSKMDHIDAAQKIMMQQPEIKNISTPAWIENDN